MRPTHKFRCALGTAAALLCAGSVWNCSNDTAAETSSAPFGLEHANVALKLEYNETPLLDSLVLDCYGTDTLHLVKSPKDANFNLDLFPNDNWSFKAKIYANGDLMQIGEKDLKLDAGANVNLNIQMHPIVGFVYVEVPLGLSNSAGVKNGKMTLTSQKDSYNIPMVMTANSAVFKSGMLNLGANYDVEIVLYDDLGKEIYKLKDNFLLSEDSPVPKLTLNSLRAQVYLAVQAAAEKNVNLTLPLPAGYRLPKANELLITEYLSAPNTRDRNQYEFVEIFNGSLDTLILDDCTLDIVSGSSSKSFPLITSEILPAQALVLGSPTNSNTPPEYINTEGWLDLGNSKGAIALTCGGVTMDELYYSSAPDSIHTNVVPALGSSKNGSSGQLNIEMWEDRKDSTAWCLGNPTPGKLSYCN